MITQYAIHFATETITEVFCENPVYTKRGKLRANNVFVDKDGNRYKPEGGAYIGTHCWYRDCMEPTREEAESYLNSYIKNRDQWEAGREEREAQEAAYQEKIRLQNEAWAAKHAEEKAAYATRKALEEEEWRAALPVIQAEWEGLVSRLPVYPGFERILVDEDRIMVFCTMSEADAFVLFSGSHLTGKTALFSFLPILNEKRDGVSVTIARKGDLRNPSSEGLSEFVEIIEKHREYLETHLPEGLGPKILPTFGMGLGDSLSS